MCALYETNWWNPYRIPVIVGCIIAGLFIISMLMCLFRCIMCGYACCACCCGGCGGSSRRRHKEGSTTYVLPPPAPIIDRPPQPPPPQPHYAPQAHYDEPKYAYFDKPSDDALPHMPSAKGIEVKQEIEESHEMVNVRRSPSPQAMGMHAPPMRPGEVYQGQPPPNATPNYYPTGTTVSSPYNTGNGPYVQARPHLAPPGPYAGGAGEQRNITDYYPTGTAVSGSYHAGNGPYVQSRPHLTPQGPYAGGGGEQRNIPDYYPTNTVDSSSYNAGNGPHSSPYKAEDELHIPHQAPQAPSAGAIDVERTTSQKMYQRREYQRQEYQAYNPSSQRKPEEWTAL